MMNFRSAYYLLFLLIVFLKATPDVSAQRFSVASFRQLPNDVSAFIDPVRDLNDEDCGLVKVIASEDFAFSTPLGIVKRVDKVGEIWLYLPRGSKKITIKHPEWGVLRDYVFTGKIDSHMTYELRIDEPLQAAAAVSSKPLVTTVRDTLVLTRVDTLVVTPVKKRLPLNINVLATVGYGGKLKSGTGGVLAMALKRHGGFVHFASDFGKIGPTAGECDKNGKIANVLPFYSGRTRQSVYMVNAGPAHRVTDRLVIYEGIGYSAAALAWELAPSEGGGYVRNSYYCKRGVSFEAGMAFAFKRLTVSASVISIKGSEWFGSVGIGIKLGK